MRAIIVDDEILNIQLLQSFCKRYAPSIEVVDTADHAGLAIELIIKHTPDLVFLDVQLHDKTAFDVLKNIQQPNLMVIIVTAYEKYALQAVRVRVIDYILKPVSIDEFTEAVSKCEAELKKIQKLTRSHDNDASISEPEERYITVPYREYIELIGFDNVLHIEAKGSYTAITTMDKMEHISSKTMKEYEERLPLKNFLKVHKSHIVNISGIVECTNTRTSSLLLVNGREVPISQRRKLEVLAKLNP